MKANRLLGKTSKTLIVFALSVITVFCLMASVLTFQRGKAQTATLTGVEFATSYAVGMEVEIPEGTITVGNNEYTVSPVVFYPNGSAYKLTKATLNQKGKYVVDYSVDVGGTNYSVKKEFIASEYVFANSATGEPLKYLHNDTHGYDGIHFSVRPSEKAVYNKVVDLSDNTKNDTLIKVDAIPDEIGVRDAETLWIVFTDLYDANNTLSIRIRRAPKEDGATFEYWSYIAAAHNGLNPTGWDGKYFFNSSDVYGYGVRNGNAGKTQDLHYAFDLRLDYENKELWAASYSETSYPNLHEGKIVDFVDDFGNNPWKGFTTGEAMLSIYADNYSTSNTALPYNGIILELDGHNLSEGIAEDGTVGAATVTVAPTPKINFGEYSNANSIPKAVVGYGYKVFDASITSIHGGEKLSTHVYYGYNTSTVYEVNVKDGKFVPDLDGLYTIVYTCTDVFGNQAEVSVDVEAVSADTAEMTVEVPGYENYKECMVGELFTILTEEDVVVSNNFGNVTISVVATHVDSNETIVVNNGQFTPKKAGEWTIKYTAIDYVGRSDEFSYTATVELSDGVIFANKVNYFSKYLIVNADNPIPTTTYIDYAVSAEEQTVETVYLEDQNGEKVADVLNGFVKPTAAGKYYVVYEATAANSTTPNKKKMEVTAVDVGFKNLQDFNLGKYFYSSDVVEYLDATSRSVTFEVAANGQADFIRPVNATNIRFKFNLDSSRTAANSVIVKFVDVNNENQAIELEFKNRGSSVSVNGSSEYPLSGYSFGGNADYSIIIKNGELSVGSQTIKLNKYLNGDNYTGFDSNLVNLSVQAVNASGNTGNTRFVIKEVGNQKLNKPVASNVDQLDKFAPEVVTTDSFNTVLLINEPILISASKILDVVDPYAVATLSVVDKNGNYYKDENGVIMKNVDIDKDYVIVPEKTGMMYIQYEITDSSRETVWGPEIEIISREAPVITITGGARTAKVNQEFSVGTATVSGNTDSAELYVYILPPSGRMKKITNGKYTAKTAGDYKVTYIAIDEWGNMAVENYTVKVS